MRVVAEVSLAVATIGLAASLGYVLLVVAGALKFHLGASRQLRAGVASPISPVTLMKPLHGMEPRLRENLESFFRQDFPQFEIIFGVRSSADPALRVVKQLAEQYPAVPIKIVVSGQPEWANAKVYSLQKMLAQASHDILVISDSDVRVPVTYLRIVAAPLHARQVGLITCLYRGVPTESVWSRLEAVIMSTKMTAGVLAADLIEGMNFALGPTMALRRDALEAIGGFSAIADYLADDFVLGEQIARHGYEVLLSACVVEHYAINRSFSSSFAHQVRWAKSTRFSRPNGHLGAAFTFPSIFGCLGAAALFGMGHAAAALCFFGVGSIACALENCAAGWWVAGDRSSVQWAALGWLRDLFGFVVWAASLLGSRHVIWRDHSYALVTNGRMNCETRANDADDDAVGAGLAPQSALREH